MAIKVDLEKAYDRLDWNFIAHTLREIGFQEQFTNVIMTCIGTASMKVI